MPVKTGGAGAGFRFQAKLRSTATRALASSRSTI
jgi:hypothetical protein